jgi:hypothetical protein
VDFRLTYEKLRLIENPKQRDEAFWEILRPLINDTNQSSRELINLYKQAEIDAFLYAVSKVEFSPQVEAQFLAESVNPEDIRTGLVRHYTNIKETLISMHDLDFYTKGASGDIKSYQTAVNYFQNAYFIEAVQDPLIETLMQSNEQALKEIRDNNNGYIPPAMISYDPLTQENLWDKRTLEIFEAKVRAGTVHDYERTAYGYGVLDETGLRYKTKERPLTLEEFKSQRLRMLASVQIAKGAGLLTQRTLEIFAKSKTPGFDSRQHGTNQLVFSSKGYEGIARWLSPMNDWFGKYRMGTLEHRAFFGLLIGLEENDLKSFITMNPKQWENLQILSKEGRLGEWIEEKYGRERVNGLLNAFGWMNHIGVNPEQHHGAVEYPQRMHDAVDKFMFSGRLGPLSGWGETDTTIGMTDLDREKEGGAMRLFKANEWATRKVVKEFEGQRLRQNIPNWEQLTLEQQAEARKPYEGQLAAEWEKIWSDDKTYKPYEARIKMHARAYRAMIWVQMAQRSPTIIAPHVEVPGRTYYVRGEQLKKNLRAVVLEDILGNDELTRRYLAEKIGGNPEAIPADQLRLDMIKDVASEKTPDTHHRKLYARIGVLEADVMAIQQKALYGGPGGRPRDIGEADFEVLNGNVDIVVNNKKVGVVNEETRRAQAKAYVDTVRRNILGSRNEQDWMNRLGRELGATNDYTLANAEQIDAILHEASEQGSLMNQELLDKNPGIHMGLEDLHWRELDWPALGERHWARRAADLQARVNTTLGMIKYLDLVRMHPDDKEMVKVLTEMSASEKEHFPLEGEKFVWLWARATGEMYKENWVGKIPFLGRILPKMGLPVSIMQWIYGGEKGASWSANNLFKFAHDVQSATHMSPKRWGADGQVHPYNAEELENGLGATRRTAALEMLLIGGGIAFAATAVAAIGTGVKSETDQEGHH